jgi:hypothetical protein
MEPSSLFTPYISQLAQEKLIKKISSSNSDLAKELLKGLAVSKGQIVTKKELPLAKRLLSLFKNEKKAVRSTLESLKITINPLNPLASKYMNQESQLLKTIQTLFSLNGSKSRLEEKTEEDISLIKKPPHLATPQLEESIRQIINLLTYMDLDNFNEEKFVQEIKNLGIDKVDYPLFLNTIAQLSDIQQRDKLEKIAIINIITAISEEYGIAIDFQVKNQTINSEEGSVSTLTHFALAHSVKKFFKETKPKPHSALSRLPEETKKQILFSLEKSISYTGSVSSTQDLLSNYKAGNPITLGTGWYKHGVEVTLHNGYLIYTNKGERLERFESQMKLFKINGEVNEDFINRLKNYNGNNSNNLKKQKMEWLEGRGGMQKDLDLQKIGIIPKKDQKIGNCAWANTKGGFHAELLLLMLESKLKENSTFSPKDALISIQNDALEIFKDWEYFNRFDKLKVFLDLSKEVFKPNFSLSPQSYFAFFAEMSFKFFGTNNQHKKYERILPDYATKTSIIEHAENMKKMVKEFMSDFPINIQDCFVKDLNEKDAKNLLNNAEPGAFILHTIPQPKGAPDAYAISYLDPQSMKVVNQQFKLIQGQGQDIPIFELESGHQVKSLKDLMVSIPTIHFPIMNEKLTFEVLQGPSSLDSIRPYLLYISNKEAEEILEKKSRGTWLLHYKQNRGELNYFISYKDQDQVRCIPIIARKNARKVDVYEVNGQLMTHMLDIQNMKIPLENSPCFCLTSTVSLDEVKEIEDEYSF